MKRFLLLALFLCPLIIVAELPPSAYEAMQAKAPEYLNIEVLRVDIEAGAAPEQQKVHVMAMVNKVNRTANDLKEGDVVNFTYAVTDHPKGWSGPKEIPILSEKDKTIAYLVRIENSTGYQPAAGAMSFQNF